MQVVLEVMHWLIAFRNQFVLLFNAILWNSDLYPSWLELHSGSPSKLVRTNADLVSDSSVASDFVQHACIDYRSNLCLRS